MAATTLNAVAMTAMAINLSASDHSLDSRSMMEVADRGFDPDQK
jgi:hypothetical protein